MTRTSRWCKAGAAIALATALNACGGGSSSTSGTSASPSSKGPSSSTATAVEAEETSVTAASAEGGSSQKGGDGCDVLSDEVVSRLLGVEVVRREPGGDAGAGRYSCVKGSARSQDPSTFNYVSVGVTPGGGPALLDALGSQEGSQPVSGFGEDAAYLPSAGLLVVSVGGDAVQAQIIEGGVPGSLADAKTVMSDVLDRRG